MKELKEFLIGLVCAIIGAFLFLSNVEVYGFYSGMYSMGGGKMFHTGSTTSAIIFILLAVVLFATIVRPSFANKCILFALFILFIVSILLSIKFNLKTMDAATLFLIIGTFVVGLGLIFRALLGVSAAEEKRESDEIMDKYKNL